ncbi:MAG: hypothetical protein H6996_09805 [Moraxellaceae bacterium]|nr:hypothetical protein [Pseudomonadales bacterium]MCP5175384.1 hypothetical protein [Moraxellaceae bacterium]MCP5177111.1 hypothetical protein [Moraxellaceae bacterium]
MNEQLNGNELVKEFNELISKISAEVAVKSMNPELINSYTLQISKIVEKCNINVNSKVDSIPLMIREVLKDSDSKRKEDVEAKINKIENILVDYKKDMAVLKKGLESMQKDVSGFSAQVKSITYSVDAIHGIISNIATALVIAAVFGGIYYFVF